MDSVREAWTDERLDDLNHRVDEGFREMRAELRAEIGSVRKEMQSLRSETNGNLEVIHLRLDGIHRVMVYGVVSLSTAMLAGLLAIATQL